MNLRLPTRFVLLDKAIATLGSVGSRALPGLQRVRGREAVRARARSPSASRRSASRSGRGTRRRSSARSRSSCRARCTTCSNELRDGQIEVGFVHGPRRPRAPHRRLRQPDRGRARRRRRPDRLDADRRLRRGRPARARAARPLGGRVRPVRRASGSGSSGASCGPGGCSLLARQDSAGAESCGLIPAFGGAHP